MVQPVAPEFRAVEMLGWIDHDEAWEKGEPSGYDPENTRVIAQEQLNPAMWYAEHHEQQRTGQTD